MLYARHTRVMAAGGWKKYRLAADERKREKARIAFIQVFRMAFDGYNGMDPVARYLQVPNLVAFRIKVELVF